MFRSLHRKLVVILMLLVVSVMAVVGTILVNSITSFYAREFRQQLAQVLTAERIETFQAAARGDNPDQALYEVVSAYSSSLGIDNYRNVYILDGETGRFLQGSNRALGQALEKTPNLIAAMAGEVGDSGRVVDGYMDLAVPLETESGRYLLYIKDTTQEMQSLTSMIFSITVQAILFGLVVAVLLSILLSKTITNPIENLTRSAKRMAAGDFSHPAVVQSSDEIGVLTQTFNDMSQVLQKTLEEVQGERDKLNTLFLHMTDGVASFTRDGKIMQMNPAAERMLGISFSPDLTMRDVYRGMAGLDERRARERGYMESEITRDGRTYTICLASFGAQGENEGGILSVVHDVTEQKKLDEVRREFVANVSHELRTPLTNIRSYTETLLDSEGQLPAETNRHFLEIISGEADRMARIVKDLLTLSRLDYGRMDVRFTRFSLRAMLERVRESMDLEARGRNQSLVSDLPADLGYMVGDRERLEQVVVNIISNAIKYTPDGGHIRLSARPLPQNRVRIEVQDDGIGIPQEDIPRLFERFYRVDKARSREKGGTGLGLAIAKEMVELHHGSIEVESRVDHGTCVRVTLPVDLPLPAEEGLDETQ